MHKAYFHISLIYGPTNTDIFASSKYIYIVKTDVPLYFSIYSMRHYLGGGGFTLKKCKILPTVTN